MPHEDDSTLIDAILSGEVGRFVEIVARFDGVVRGAVARLVRGPGARDEVVQQAFCLAFENLRHLRSPDQLQAWLLSIARRCAADHRRVTSRRERVLEEEVAETGVAPLAWVWEEIAMLPPSFREVLEFRYRDGCSYKEIASRLRVPVSTVNGRIYEARRALRERLGEEGPR